MTDIAAWLLKRLVAPVLLIWLITIILLVVILNNPLLFSSYIGIASLIVFPVAIVFSPLAIFSFYAGKIRRVYPLLHPGNEPKVSSCNICNEKITVKPSRSFLWMPYSFLDLRHYEERHLNIARDARRARLSIIAQTHAVVFGMAGLVAFWNTFRFADTQLDLSQAIIDFSVPLLLIVFVAWGILLLAYRARRHH